MLNIIFSQNFSGAFQNQLGDLLVLSYNGYIQRTTLVFQGQLAAGKFSLHPKGSGGRTARSLRMILTEVPVVQD